MTYFREKLEVIGSLGHAQEMCLDDAVLWSDLMVVGAPESCGAKRVFTVYRACRRCVALGVDSRGLS